MLKKTSFSLLVLRAAVFLILSWVTFKGIHAGSERGWHLSLGSPNPMNTSMEMKHNRTDVLDTGYTIEKSSFPFIFKPSPYAYVFYARTDEYACAVLVNINRLQSRFFTRHRIHVLLSKDVSTSYFNAITLTGATITIRDSPPISNTSQWDTARYKDFRLKLLAFGLHEIEKSFERIIVMDADQLILQNLDHVFDLPQTDLAAPRADWIARDFIASTFMVISLSDRLWNTVKDGLETIEPSMYDVDLINKLFANNVLVLPTSFVALNKLWYSWTTPDWYRPEEAEKHKDRGNPEEIDELAAERFWHAISILSESNPFAEDSVAGESDENRDIPVPSATQPGHQVTESSQDTTTRSITDNITDSTTPSSEKTTTSVMDQTVPQFRSTSSASKPKRATGLQSSATSAPHDSTDALVTLYKYNAKILNFSNSTKPWMWNMKELEKEMPGGHPLYYEQWRTWREEAKDACPSMRRVIARSPSNGGSTNKQMVEAPFIDVI